MHEIICPHCSKAFKIDEAGYADILKQVRDGEFEQALHERLELAEREKQGAIALAKADVTNTWGPLNGPGWRENDPYINAAKLRGTKIYITSGTGIPGKHDQIDYIHDLNDAFFWSDRYVAGGFIEAVTNQCTHQMVDRLHQLKIPVTVNYRPTGTHSWGYWEDDLHTTWPKIDAPTRLGLLGTPKPNDAAPPNVGTTPNVSGLICSVQPTAPGPKMTPRSTFGVSRVSERTARLAMPARLLSVTLPTHWIEPDAPFAATTAAEQESRP